MKKKVLAVIMAFVLSAAAMSAATVQPALAQGTESQMETAVFSEIAGFWKNADSEGETLTITEDGFFLYRNEDEDFQGYLEYVDEYGDGNGRYDMYNGDDIWLAGLYQDSENSLHMGNDEGTVFIRTDESWEVIEEEQWEEEPGLSLVLSSAVQYPDMVSMYNDPFWYDGYYYADMTEDGTLVIVNCCAYNGEFADATTPEFMEAFAAMVSETEIMDYQVSQNQELTVKFTYPVHDITFTTGANEDTCLWRMTFLQTDTHTYAYAFKMDADFAEDMEEEYWNAVNSLEFIELPNIQNGYMDYDPSANGESLEDFIAYFDSWFMDGDLKSESLYLYGDGTWLYRNAIEEDGTGGYIFDDGTFETFGTTGLMLYSADGSYVADVSLNEYGALILTPVLPGYGNFYGDVVFLRESESFGYADYDPSANGESLEDCIAFFDTWYQYGDLNAESICLYGDGTWAYYNAINEDGTGGYLFDEGTFIAAGTNALQLYSSDGSYVMDASLDEYGDLMLTPVDPDYGSFYADVAYIRASESVAYEAQTAEN